MTFMCLWLYGRHLSDKNIAEKEAMICSAAWWKQWISPRFKSSFLVFFCFLYGVTYKPSRAGQNCYTWWCYPQWMYLQVTIIKIYLSIYLSIISRTKKELDKYLESQKKLLSCRVGLEILTLNMLNYLKDYKRYIHVLNRVLDLAISGTTRHVVCHGIDPQSRNIPSPASEELTHQG